MRVHAFASALILSTSLSHAAKFPLRRVSSDSSALDKRSGIAHLSRPVVLAASQNNSDSDAATLR